MKKYQEFYETTSSADDRTKIAVRATGLQTGEHRIWVLNSRVQYDSDGDLLDVDSSPYIWLGRFSGNRETAGIDGMCCTDTTTTISSEEHYPSMAEEVLSTGKSVPE